MEMGVTRSKTCTSLNLENTPPQFGNGPPMLSHRKAKNKKNIQRKHSLLDIDFSVISPVHPVGLCERLMTGGAPNLALEGPSLHAKAPGLGGACEFALGLGTARLSRYVQSDLSP